MSCFICENTKLVPINNKFECPKCKDIYYKCNKCEQDGEDVFDSDENDKGLNCMKCNKHFCITCWQSSGEVDDCDDYLCEKCIK